MPVSLQREHPIGLPRCFFRNDPKRSFERSSIWPLLAWSLNLLQSWDYIYHQGRWFHILECHKCHGVQVRPENILYSTAAVSCELGLRSPPHRHLVQPAAEQICGHVAVMTSQFQLPSCRAIHFGVCTQGETCLSAQGHTWSWYLLNQTLCASRGVLPTQTASGSPMSKVEVFHTTSSVVLLTGDAKDQTWDILYIKQLLYHWASVFFLMVMDVWLINEDVQKHSWMK